MLRVAQIQYHQSLWVNMPYRVRRAMRETQRVVTRHVRGALERRVLDDITDSYLHVLATRKVLLFPKSATPLSYSRLVFISIQIDRRYYTHNTTARR